MKKLISMALATVMAASLACTAFATSTLTRTSNLSGKYNAPTINVTIPTTGAVVLNPYKLAYTVKAATDSTEAVTANDLIVFDEAQIINKSNVGVEISAVVTGKPTNITLEKASVKKTNDDGTVVDAKTTKSAYMYVWFANATYTAGAEEGDPATVVGNYATKDTSDTDDTQIPDPAFTAVAATDNTPARNIDAILIQSTASKSTPVLTLAAPSVIGEDNAVADADATYGVFKITGDIVSKPATAYDAKDKVDVTIAWTITPLMAEEAEADADNGQGD